MARESVLVDMVVHRLTKKSAKDYPLYEIVEQCMNTMDYDDSLSIDEVAEMVEHQVYKRFPIFKNRDSWEQYIMQEMLQEKEQEMERLSKRTGKLKVLKASDGDEWCDFKDNKSQRDWNHVLMRVDKLDDRYRAMNLDTRENLMGDGMGAESS